MNAYGIGETESISLIELLYHMMRVSGNYCTMVVVQMEFSSIVKLMRQFLYK